MRVIAVSADSAEDNRALTQKLQVPFTMLSDPKLEAIRSFGVLEAEHDLAVPAIFLLNAQGQTVWREIGEAIQDRVKCTELLKVIDDLQARGDLVVAPTKQAPAKQAPAKQAPAKPSGNPAN